MTVFLSYRIIDQQKVEQILSSLTDISSTVQFVSHNSSNQDETEWKQIVENKIKSSEKVLFILGESATSSKAIEWEFGLTIKLLKPFRIIMLSQKSKLPSYTNSFIEHILKPSSQQELKRFLLSSNKLITNEGLLLEQYKIMIASSEKVTEQRAQTNNLFFTITSTVLSFSIILGKEFQFNELALVMMIALAAIALVCTFFWQKLISSYGCLNTGKFKVISELEHQLKTNLFQREWDILINEVKYRSNTRTETTIIKSYRVFIIIIVICEVIYTITKYFKTQLIWLQEYLHHLL